MRLRVRDHYTSSTLIGRKGGVDPSLLHTTFLRDQERKWMQDGCKVRMDSYMASNGSCSMVTWIIFRNHLLEGRPNTKPGDYGTPNAHNHWFILFYHGMRTRAWIKIHWNSIWLRTWSHMTSHDTWGSVTTLHDFGGVLGRPLDTLFWAHNFMVTALGSWVKRPYIHCFICLTLQIALNGGDFIIYNLIFSMIFGILQINKIHFCQMVNNAFLP